MLINFLNVEMTDLNFILLICFFPISIPFHLGVKGEVKSPKAQPFLSELPSLDSREEKDEDDEENVGSS